MRKVKPDHLPPDIRAKVNILRSLRVTVVNDHPGGILYFRCPAWPHEEPNGQAIGYDIHEIDRAIKTARFRWEVTKPQEGQLQLFTHPAATKGCERWKRKLIMRYKNK